MTTLYILWLSGLEKCHVPVLREERGKRDPEEQSVQGEFVLWYRLCGEYIMYIKAVAVPSFSHPQIPLYF